MNKLSSQTLRFGLVFLTAAMAAGCAVVYEGAYDYDAGWRKGKIVEIAAGDAIKARSAEDCRGSATADSPHAIRYAAIEYQGFRRRPVRIVPLAPDVEWQVGDLVVVNIKTCIAPVR